MSKKASLRTKFNRFKARGREPSVRLGALSGVCVVIAAGHLILGTMISPIVYLPAILLATLCGFVEGKTSVKPLKEIGFVKVDDSKYVPYSSNTHKKTDSISYEVSESQYGALGWSFSNTTKLQTKLEAAKTDRQRKRLQKKIDKKIRFQNDVISGLKVVK